MLGEVEDLWDILAVAKYPNEGYDGYDSRPRLSKNSCT